jgi:hypothetical protein
LAELVVEFPDDKPQPAGHGAAAEDDVLAQIEKARQELDSAVSGRGDPKDPLAGGRFKPDAKPASRPAGAPAGTPPAAHAPAAAAASPPAGAGIENPFVEGTGGIALPSLLSIEQVYGHAGLEPKPEQLDIFRVEQMLADPEMADLDLSIRARTVKMTLKTMGKELHEVLLDAARRDQALDAYAQWLADAVARVEGEVQAANERLKREVEEFTARKNAEIEANRALLEQAWSSQRAFVQDKAKEEQRLFDIAAPFVASGENPVVVGGKAAAPKGERK